LIGKQREEKQKPRKGYICTDLLKLLYGFMVPALILVHLHKSVCTENLLQVYCKNLLQLPRVSNLLDVVVKCPDHLQLLSSPIQQVSFVFTVELTARKSFENISMLALLQ